MAAIPNLNLNSLVIFYVVAKEGSLSLAANKLFLTQPAVSYHIQSLEEYTRVKLLDFKRRQVILTPYGRELFKYAKEIYQQLIDAERFINFIRESNLRVGITSIYNTLVGPLVNDLFENRDPEVRLTVKSGDAMEMVRDVIEATLDLAIVPRFDYKNGKLNHIQVSQPEKIVCFASTQQVIKKEPLEWKDLHDYALVTGSETSVVRTLLFNKIKEKGLEAPVLAAEVGDSEWCKSLVENGKGLSFTLVSDIEKQVAERRLRLVPMKEYIYLTAEAITRADVSNPIIEEFISKVKQVFGYREDEDSSTVA